MYIYACVATCTAILAARNKSFCSCMHVCVYIYIICRNIQCKTDLLRPMGTALVCTCTSIQTYICRNTQCKAGSSEATGNRIVLLMYTCTCTFIYIYICRSQHTVQDGISSGHWEQVILPLRDGLCISRRIRWFVTTHLLPGFFCWRPVFAYSGRTLHVTEHGDSKCWCPTIFSVVGSPGFRRFGGDLACNFMVVSASCDVYRGMRVYMRMCVYHASRKCMRELHGSGVMAFDAFMWYAYTYRNMSGFRFAWRCDFFVHTHDMTCFNTF